MDDLEDFLERSSNASAYEVRDPRVILSGTQSRPLCVGLDSNNDPAAVVINPHLLIPTLTQHFEGYIARLRDVANTTLRENFERRWEYLHKRAEVSIPPELWLDCIL
jgi:hypothetical protein